MGISVIELNNFYHTHLGAVANLEISREIDFFTPNSGSDNVVFIGFTPSENPYKISQSAHTIYISLAQQGALYLPDLQEKHHQILSYEDTLPIPDESIDRVILLHAIENSHNSSFLLNEVFRILKGKGKLLVISPNRRGLWAQSTNTPFGYGHPYTMTQLVAMLNESNFTPTKTRRCLYLLPSQNPFLLRMWPLFDYIGKTLFRKFSGLIAVEAIKTVRHPISMGIKKRAPITLTNPKGKMIEA